MQTHHEGKATHPLPHKEAAVLGLASTDAGFWNLMDGRPRGDSTLSEATSITGSDGGTQMYTSLRVSGGTYGATTYTAAGYDGASNVSSSKATDENAPCSGFLVESMRSVASFLNTRQRLLPEVFQSLSDHWIPGNSEDPIAQPATPSEQSTTPRRNRRGRKPSPQPPAFRSWKRRIFLILTEPETSIASALFFGVLVVTITLMNVVMILQTIGPPFQFTPTDCRTCGGPVSYVFDDDNVISSPPGVLCVCPPSPQRWTVVVLNALIYFFTVEWCLRVITFEPPPSPLLSPSQHQNNNNNNNNIATAVMSWFGPWFGHLTSTATVLDALAIFPYYIEKCSTHANGLMSLRLLRLLRVFQLVRLGSYNETFTSLTAVLFQSVPYLQLLLGVLLFGAAFFGSLMYWLEKGDWQYWDDTGDWQFVRVDSYGHAEISPFSSVPQAFWWFFVTATTVGYGDIVPATALGKLIATFAMLTGVLVVAFPVSVFSDLWSRELHKTKAWRALDVMEEDNDDHHSNNNDKEELHSDRRNNADTMHNNNNNTCSDDCVGNRLPLDNASGGIPWPVDDNHIVVHKDDLDELVQHMQTIQDSQEKIRRILSQYRLHHLPSDSHNHNGMVNA